MLRVAVRPSYAAGKSIEDFGRHCNSKHRFQQAMESYFVQTFKFLEFLPNNAEAGALRFDMRLVESTTRGASTGKFDYRPVPLPPALSYEASQETVAETKYKFRSGKSFTKADVQAEVEDFLLGSMEDACFSYGVIQSLEVEKIQIGLR